MNRLFKLKENGTTVRTEILAGLTTFMTMAYIVALNPNLLTGFGSLGGQALWNGVFMATCIASAIGTILMGFLANKPFAMSAGMGLNTFFSLVVTNIVGMLGYATISDEAYISAFQAALVLVFIEGLVFVALSVLNIREKIVEAIPLPVRLGIGPAIGIMLLNIGFGSNAGVYNDKGEAFYIMKDFFGALTSSFAREQMGSAYPQMVLTVVTVFFGLLIIFALNRKKVHGAVLFGMLAASGVYWAGEAVFLKTNPFASLKGASFLPPIQDMVDTTLFKLNFKGFMEIGWVTIITLIVTFCIIDMFDTIGTLVGTATRAKMVDENGKMPKMKQALLSDAIGTVAGSLTGTSTITTFVESAAGVEAGGRTGLTAVTTGVMFLLCMFIAPIAGIIPAAATSSALVYVGILMLGNLKEIDFKDITHLLPVAIMLITMPISGSIGHGIGLALIAYTAAKVVQGKAKEVSVLTYILSALFIVKFFAAV